MTIKRKLAKKFPKLNRYYNIFYRSFLRNKNSYLHKTGWFKSLSAGTPMDKDGNPIPWMNYPTIEFLEERLNKDLTMFEFGSGYSTSFYAKYCNKVTSIEYDKNWLEVIKTNLPENANLIYTEKDIDGKYCRSIKETSKKYDVVVVDGRDRVNCVKQGLDCLTENGVLLLDDSHRERYAEGLEYGISKGYKTLHFQGLKPTGYRYYRTTLFYKNNNCLNI